MKRILRFTGEQHAELRQHLFPADGMEAVALVLCGRLDNGDDAQVLTAREIVVVPHDACVRAPESITWPTHFADALINKAIRHGGGILKIHSHPGGFERFSEFDDRSDRSFFRSVADALDDGRPHASVVMLPDDGRMFGRLVSCDGEFEAVDVIAVAGDEIKYWFDRAGERDRPEFVERHAQAFGAGTVEILQRMSVAVVGCSGTGSPLIEQLVRLGVGKLVLVDPDRVEHRNLNRIYMTTARDAAERRLKVVVLAEAIQAMGLGTDVVPVPAALESPSVVRAVAQCDLIFGCMDTVSGRDMLNRLASFYLVPYIDVGVQLDGLADGGIDRITVAVHYLQPGRSSLRTRGVYTSEEVSAEVLRRDSPAEYERRLEEKYIRGVQEARPAVISVNSYAASLAAMEMLARLHNYRFDGNSGYAAQRHLLHDPSQINDAESKLERGTELSRYIGRGDLAPLLDRPELTEGTCLR